MASPERVADAVVGAREAHRAVAVDLADDDPVRGRTLRSRGERLLQHPLLLLREVPPGVRRHEHRVVKDLHEAVVTDELDGLARQVAADVVLEVERAHLAVHEHPPEQARGRWTGFTLRGWRHRRRLLEGRRMRGGEALGRGPVAEALVLAAVVAVVHPGVDRCLRLGDRREDLAVQELPLQRLVEALDLAGGGR